jgi:hypothetical protein
MESLIFAAVIGFTIYLFMRRLRMMKETKRRQAEELERGGPPEEPKSMPRLGSPGTLTRHQINWLKDNNFEPSRVWSKEEAQLIIDTVVYLRAVTYTVTNETDPPLDVQNHLLKFILTNDELREYVYEWGLNRTRDDDAEPQPVLERSAQFTRVEAEVLAQWESS